MCSFALSSNYSAWILLLMQFNSHILCRIYFREFSVPVRDFYKQLHVYCYTTVHNDYSGNLQYMKDISNKYILTRELSCILIVRNKPTICKNIIHIETYWSTYVVTTLQKFV